MRPFLFSLLALMLALNASYMASVAICGALENSVGHTKHFGHHNHNHSDDHAQDEHAQVDLAKDNSQSSVDEPSKVTSNSDHYHHHVHPSFPSILPSIIGVLPLTGTSPLVAASPSAFISVTHVLLDRPPCVPLA